jgi:tRNA threonylcarbamoyladenosine biosynthesis protein TsaE
MAARRELRSDGPEQTQRLGALLGAALRPGDVILLHGGLGAGKTALTQGIARGLGVTETVNSPTFTILKEYSGRLPLYHFDLYRIEHPDELLSLGFEQYFDAGDGICVVEWAERGEVDPSEGGALWPDDWLRIELIKLADDVRLLRCAGAGARGAELVSILGAAEPANDESADTADTAETAGTPAAPGAE